MNTVIIACQTLQNELEAAMAACNFSCEIPAGSSRAFTTSPKKLHATLQEHLDQCDGFDTVLLVMGYCGNSVADIETHDFQLVIPAGRRLHFSAPGLRHEPPQAVRRRMHLFHDRGLAPGRAEYLEGNMNMPLINTARSWARKSLTPCFRITATWR